MLEGTWSASAIFDAIKIIIFHSKGKSYSEDNSDFMSAVKEIENMYPVSIELYKHE